MCRQPAYMDDESRGVLEQSEGDHGHVGSARVKRSERRDSLASDQVAKLDGEGAVHGRRITVESFGCCLTTGVQPLARARPRVLALAGRVTVGCNGMLGRPVL